jgi:hypothetical protein
MIECRIHSRRSFFSFLGILVCLLALLALADSTSARSAQPVVGFRSPGGLHGDPLAAGAVESARKHRPNVASVVAYLPVDNGLKPEK